jgi:hypothetical protein
MGALTSFLGAIMLKGTPFAPEISSDTITHTLLGRLILMSGPPGLGPDLPGAGMGRGGMMGALAKGGAISVGILAMTSGITAAMEGIQKETDERKKANRKKGAWGGGAGGALAGAAAGAALGSVVPVLGTTVGAIAGGMIGAGGGAWGGAEIGANFQDGGITQGVSIAGEAGPEAVVPLPDGRTIPVQLNTAAYEPLIKKLDEVANRITDAVNKAQTVVLISDLEAAGFRRGNSAVLYR